MVEGRHVEAERERERIVQGLRNGNGGPEWVEGDMSFKVSLHGSEPGVPAVCFPACIGNLISLSTCM